MFLDDLVKRLSEYLQIYGECFETATKNCSPLLKVRNKDDCSLLSCRDVRIMIVALLKKLLDSL
jgi:hypothetical protein